MSWSYGHQPKAKIISDFILKYDWWKCLNRECGQKFIFVIDNQT